MTNQTGPKSLKSFWSACEKLSSAGIMKEWEEEIQDAELLEAAKKLLVPMEQLAQYYPCTNKHKCSCSHEVVAHRDGAMTAVCSCEDWDCEPIPVTEADLTVYEMDHSRILGGIAIAAGLTPVQPIRVDIHEPSHFADLDVGGKLIPAYFAMTDCSCLSQEKLIRLIAGSYEPFILFTPSPFYFHIYGNIQEHQRFHICLSDLLFIEDDEKIGFRPELRNSVEQFGRKAQGLIKAQNVRKAHSESVFEHSNNYHTIVLNGKELPHLTDLQADVAKVLHEAHLQGKGDVKYAVISCEIADMHADELGFEPPSKMSQIFRSGDTRSVLMVSTKSGYYRLNI